MFIVQFSDYLTLVKMIRFLKEIYWHLMDFADNTKLHGPRYISDQARPRIERLVIKLEIEIQFKE